MFQPPSTSSNIPCTRCCVSGRLLRFCTPSLRTPLVNSMLHMCCTLKFRVFLSYAMRCYDLQQTSWSQDFGSYRYSVVSPLELVRGSVLRTTEAPSENLSFQGPPGWSSPRGVTSLLGGELCGGILIPHISNSNPCNCYSSYLCLLTASLARRSLKGVRTHTYHGSSVPNGVFRHHH